jgi:selenium metabolism protein YedF
MGRGDDELGQLLMRSYLKTLLQLEEKPALVMFYNTGVRLCCEGSPLLEDLAEFESAGIEIIACGTCLSFFELGDQLAIGRVTDMLEIATRLHEAGRVIRP